MKKGIEWIGAAWRQFKAFPFAWMMLIIMNGVINYIFSLTTPTTYMSFLLLPVFTGGLFLAAAAADSGTKPRIRHFFGAFTKAHAPRLIAVTPLLGVGLLAFFLFFLLVLHFMEPLTTPLKDCLEAFIDSPHFIGTFTDSPTFIVLALMGGLGWIVGYFYVAYTIILALIIFNGLSVWAAFRFAFSACLLNWRPITLYMGSWLVLLSLFSWLLSLGRPLNLFGLLGFTISGLIFVISHFYMWKGLTRA